MAFVLCKKLCTLSSNRRDIIISQAFTISSLNVYYPLSIVVPIHILISQWTHHIHHHSKPTLMLVFSFNLFAGRWSVIDPFYLFIKRKTFVQFMTSIWWWFAKYVVINCVTAPKTRLFYGRLQTSHISVSIICTLWENPTHNFYTIKVSPMIDKVEEHSVAQAETIGTAMAKNGYRSVIELVWIPTLLLSHQVHSHGFQIDSNWILII